MSGARDEANVLLTESLAQLREAVEARRRRVLRLEAKRARMHGIDTTRPGWHDELAEIQRLRDEEEDAMIATPSVNETIDRMEQQFDRKATSVVDRG